MNLTNYEAGDIKLISVKITNTNKKAAIDLKGMMLSMSIFEDLEQPTVYAELVINDSLNLVNDFPIIGEEDLEISFITPGRDKITNYYFRVFNIDGETFTENAKGSNYTLKCVSKEHFINAVNQVDKSYKDTIDKVVLDIVSNILEVGSTKKGMTIEGTRGLIPLSIPRMSPFQAIDMLRQRAIAKRDSGGVYVFYENQYGFNFVTLEKLIEDGIKVIDTKTFTHATDITSDKSRGAYAFRNITRLLPLTKFDTVKKMSTGQFKNTVISYDMTTKSVVYTDFNFKEKAKAFETGEKKATATNTDKIITEANKGAPYYMFAPKDASKGNDFVTDLLGYRQAFTTMVNENIMRCQVYGDNFLTVGDMIYIKLPETSGTTSKKTENKNFTGNYLVTKLRHMIYQVDRKFKHEIAMDCNKIGYGS